MGAQARQIVRAKSRIEQERDQRVVLMCILILRGGPETAGGTGDDVSEVEGARDREGESVDRAGDTPLAHPPIGVAGAQGEIPQPLGLHRGVGAVEAASQLHNR